MKKFVFGKLVYEYQLVKQDRKTLSLTVTPDLRLIVKCPMQADIGRIEAFLRKKWFWMEKQLSFFKKYQRKIYKKEYVSGEGYLYLGRQYKLIVRGSKKDLVSLARGKLIVHTKKEVTNSKYNKKLIDSWFAEKTTMILQERFTDMLTRFDHRQQQPALFIREMKKRWGSFVNKEKILLNPKLIHASKDCIDYVIAHELCHLKYKSHHKRFFNLLKENCPNWLKIKEKLELTGTGLC